MAVFITFEGGEGSGKSVQAKILFRRLVKKSVPCILTHEPGGTPVGEQIGKLLKWSREAEFLPLSELLLFNASRAQLVENVIRPALREGTNVICDRFADSTTAYQCFGRGLDRKVVDRVNEVGMMGLRPDMTILLDIPVGEGLARKGLRRVDRFTKEGVEFHERVRTGYIKIAGVDLGRWIIIDARLSKREISNVIWPRVAGLLVSD